MTVGYPHMTEANAGDRRRAELSSRGRVVRWVCAVPLVAVALLLGGSVWFAFHVASKETPLDRVADGIVALTGGASRISDAVELLASGRGQRLLITGVSP